MHLVHWTSYAPDNCWVYAPCNRQPKPLLHQVSHRNLTPCVGWNPTWALSPATYCWQWIVFGPGLLRPLHSWHKAAGGWGGASAFLNMLFEKHHTQWSLISTLKISQNNGLSLLRGGTQIIQNSHIIRALKQTYNNSIPENRAG